MISSCLPMKHINMALLLNYKGFLVIINEWEGIVWVVMLVICKLYTLLSADSNGLVTDASRPYGQHIELKKAPFSISGIHAALHINQNGISLDFVTFSLDFTSAALLLSASLIANCPDGLWHQFSLISTVAIKVSFFRDIAFKTVLPWMGVVSSVRMLLLLDNNTSIIQIFLPNTFLQINKHIYLWIRLQFLLARKCLRNMYFCSDYRKLAFGMLNELSICLP